MSTLAVEMFFGEVAQSPTSPPIDLPDVPLDDLVLWLDAGLSPTAGNLAPGPLWSAELGTAAGPDSADPIVTTAAGVDVWDPDASNDHIDTDYTPSLTPTTGDLTVVVIGVFDSTDTAANFPRAFSAESANSDGINIAYGGAGVTELWVTVGGATTTAFRRYQPVDGLVLADGDRFMVAATLSGGNLRIYEPSLGLSASTSTSGVGTITPSTVRFFRPTPDAIADRNADSPMQAALIYERQLTEADLDDIASAYSLGAAPEPEPAVGAFRTQQDLAYAGSPDHVLTALGYTSSAKIERADLDGILDDWVAGTGGTTWELDSESEFNSARASIVAGDLVRMTSSFTVTGNNLSLRGSLYSISGANLTATTGDLGGDEGLPIIWTCADGVEITGSGLTNSQSTFDVANCRHVWAVGLNVAGVSQFGIRFSNAGGTDGFPAYVAYCDVSQVRDWSISARGWFQDIASSGGTPPSDDGGDKGFSEFIVIESNTVTDPNPGDVAGNPGEGIYLGDGSNSDWEGYARDIWCRGNVVSNAKANAYECKPGCKRVYFTDNVAVAMRAQLGAAFELCYLSSAASRPSWANGVDFEIWCEGNRIYDYNITETGTSRNYVILVGLAGVRAANNLMWSLRNASGDFGTSDTYYGALVGHESLTTAFGDATSIDTWIVNNDIQARGVTDPVGHTGVAQRNNIVPTGYSGGQHTAGASDYAGTTPAVGSLSTADAGGGPGSAFDLDSGSALVGAGADISDIAFLIDRDIFNRPFTDKTNPNPGPFQPEPA